MALIHVVVITIYIRPEIKVHNFNGFSIVKVIFILKEKFFSLIYEALR